MKRAILLIYFAITAASRLCGQPTKISFTIQNAGQVSGAVYDNQGRMLRELARGMKLEKGDHQFVWDGLDRYGKSVPPGEYEWRLVRTPGFTREFFVNVGTNPGWAPFDLWPGNHAGPTRLMIDADMNLYIGAVSSEGPPHILKMSRDGRQKFWTTGTWGLADGLIDMARVGEAVDVLFRDGTLDILNAETGAKFRGHHQPGEILELMKRVGFIPSNYPQARKPDNRMRLADLIHPNDPEARKDPRDRQNVSEMALAAGTNFLAVIYQKYDDVRFFRAQDDVVTLTKSVRVPEPKGCCVAADGRVFVVSGHSVVRVDPATGEVKPVVLDPELVSPTRIAYDSKNNDLLVIQHSDGFDHVRRYQAADGRLIAVYGRLAGRTYGNFNPLDWGGLLDIVADGEGGFFTVEQFPRRVAHFRGREHHELVAQWFGGMQWGALCALDPADSTIVYLFPDHKHCARGRIDYGSRTWTLTQLYDLPANFSWFLGKERHRAMFPNFGGQSYWEVRHVGGTTFLVNNGRLHGGCAAVVRVDEKQNRLVPVSFLGGLHPSLDRADPPSWWLEAMKRAGYDPAKTGGKHFCFSWSDTNRNGKIDVEEVKLGSLGSTFSDAQHCFIDPEWNVYYALGDTALKAADRPSKITPKRPAHSVWFVVPNEGRADLPVWNWDDARPSVATYPVGESALGATSPSGIFHDSQGNTYLVCNGKVDWNKADVPPLTWPNNTTYASRFEKWNSAGVFQWSAGLHTSAKDRPPGEFAQVRGILGELHGCLVVLDACEPASVWTRDGLFAGSLYAEHTVDGLPHNSYNEVYQDDNHWGLIMQTHNGDVLWGGMSHNSTPIYRIRGWDNWERQSGKLTIKHPATGAQWKGTGLQAEYFTNISLSGEPALRRTDPDIWFGPMGGAFRQIKARKPWFGSAEQSIFTTTQFSARWQGFFEAPFSEIFTFVAYTYGRPSVTNLVGSKVRLWVNGELVIDEWDGVKQQKVAQGQRQTRACLSKPVALSAGQLVPIRLEFDAAGGDQAHLHLFFGTDSIDLRHVPQALLYSQKRSHQDDH